MPSAPLTEPAQAHSSALTRCPECQTGFRVTADTLMLRQGMVRCGECKSVFNALEHLVEAAQQEGTTHDAGDPAPDATTNYDLFGAASAADDPATTGTIAPVATPEAAGSATSLPRSILLHDVPRRGFAWISMLGALLAGVALAAQATWFYRDKIAATYPDAKPYLDTACAELGCRIKAPVDPQAISIESSDLQADQANRAVQIGRAHV